MNYTNKVIVVLELLKNQYVTIDFMKKVLKLKQCEVNAIIADLRYMGYNIMLINSKEPYYKMIKGINLDVRVMRDYEMYAVMDLWHDVINPHKDEVLRFVSSKVRTYEPYYLKGYRKFHGIGYNTFLEIVMRILKENKLIKIEME